MRRLLRRLGAARLNALPLLSDQFRFLRDASTQRASIVTRFVVIAIGPAGVVTSLFLHWTMQSVDELSQALGLLAGVFISAFAIVFSLRLTIAGKPNSNLQRRAARLMDESALTLLAAGFLSGVDAIWLTIVSWTVAAGDAVGVVPTSITVGLSSLVAVYFLLAIRRLHVLYTDTFPPYWRLKQAAGEDLSFDEAVARAKQQ